MEALRKSIKAILGRNIMRKIILCFIATDNSYTGK